MCSNCQSNSQDPRDLEHLKMPTGNRGMTSDKICSNKFELRVPCYPPSYIPSKNHWWSLEAYFLIIFNQCLILKGDPKPSNPVINKKVRMISIRGTLVKIMNKTLARDLLGALEAICEKSRPRYRSQIEKWFTSLSCSDGGQAPWPWKGLDRWCWWRILKDLLDDSIKSVAKKLKATIFKSCLTMVS